MTKPLAAFPAPSTIKDYAYLFDASEDAVAVFYPDLSLAYVNPTFLLVAPIRAGQTLRDHLGPLADVYDSPTLRALHNNRPIRAIHHIPSPEGGRILLGSYTPVRDTTGTATAVLLIAHDLPGWGTPNAYPETPQRWRHAMAETDDEA
ncbi:MAG: PAS domain-containing protein, partial [Rhodospirillaceae bacterium]|nr:PAS domain-containing protein [Rhodospirillaceae bacterium]